MSRKALVLAVVASLAASEVGTAADGVPGGADIPFTVDNAGDEVIIAERGRPSVRLAPVQTTTRKRRPGAWSHLAPAADDWDSPAFNRKIARDLMGDDH